MHYLADDGHLSPKSDGQRKAEKVPVVSPCVQRKLFLDRVEAGCCQPAPRESFPSYGSSLSNRCAWMWARGGILQPFDGLGNTHLQPSNLLPEGLPMDGLPVPWWVERRISSKRSRHLLFFLHDGSAGSLARRDQADVGISGALHPGVGFFGPLHAAALDPPCGEVCPARAGRARSFSMFHNNPNG